ncbi:glycoside hydrolase family protein [bacterium]|nr:glycoside hydrolase family protein [bacterium]
MIALALLATAVTSQAQNYPLRIYNGNNQTGTNSGCWRDRTYEGNEIPGGLNNKINSMKLLKHYGVVIGNNNDGVWGSRFYATFGQDRVINLSNSFKNKVSFIRVVKMEKWVQKKGYAGNDTALGKAVGADWFYNWASGSSHRDGMEYIPMKWGPGNSTNIVTFAEDMQEKQSVQLLTFNEPDNSSQSNISVSTALDRYKVLLSSGLRMGTPACEQDNYATWLDDFMDGAYDRGYRIDFIALHWYDWGNQNNNSNGNTIKNRMSAKVLNARNLLGNDMAIWMTEFNANRNRLDQDDHADFIESAIGYINGQSWWERYSYFQAGGGTFGSSSSLTTSGKAYRDAPNAGGSPGEVNNRGWQ